MKRFVRPAIALLFPFLYYSRFVIPNSSLLVLENDFGFLYYSYKAYLVDSIAHGHFPLWSPAEACGYSFFGNPFSAPIYPLNVVPIAIRLAAGHYTQWAHQIFTVLGVSVFALGTYRWLCAVYRKPDCALFVSLVLTAGWSIGGFMRFPNAIHAFAWVPWVLWALHRAQRAPRVRPVLAGVVAAFCQITAGYPYFVVYGYMLYGAYLLYLHWTERGVEWRERLVSQAAILVVPVLLSAPYFSSVSQVMSLTTDRAGGDFAYATEFPFGPLDLVGSLVFPPVTTVEGCFYLGSLTVFLLVLYFARSVDTREKIAVLVGVLAFLTLILGYRSYFFAPLWTVLPVVNQMRVFSRMTIVLLPILALAIHQGVSLFVRELEKPVNERNIPTGVVLGVFATVFAVQLALYFGRASLDDEYVKYYLHAAPAGSREIDFAMWTLVSLVVVLVLLKVEWPAVRRGPALALATLVVVTTLDTGGQGRFLWSSTLGSVVHDSGVEPATGRALVAQAWALAKHKADFYRLVRDYFSLDRVGGRLGLSDQGLSSAPTPNFDYDTYTRFYRRGEATHDLRDRLMGRGKLFFHAGLDETLPAFFADVASHAGSAAEPAIEYFDGNELRLTIKNSEPGYLSWIDNMDPGWVARVDGKAVAIERSMGTFKAVRLDAPGTHHVSFRYSPVVARVAYAGAAAGVLALLAFILRERRRKVSEHLG